jgi:hypothetical protein
MSHNAVLQVESSPFQDTTINVPVEMKGLITLVPNSIIEQIIAQLER